MGIKNDNIVSCNKCGIVFNIEDWIMLLDEYGFDEFEKEQLERKDVIYWGWIDLEQTETEYYKFCPVCNSWGYHKTLNEGDL